MYLKLAGDALLSSVTLVDFMPVAIYGVWIFSSAVLFRSLPYIVGKELPPVSDSVPPLIVIGLNLEQWVSSLSVATESLVVTGSPCS